MDASKYIPGVCNIGEAEIAQRKRVGWIGLLVTIIAAVLFDYFHVSVYWGLLLFFPASLSATGFIQAWSHFCAGFGMRGLFNFGPQINKTDTVSQAEFRKLDIKKARLIFLDSVILGAAATIIICLWR
jgi:hypothetical protein